jgi:hypothetical protein
MPLLIHYCRYAFTTFKLEFYLLEFLLYFNRSIIIKLAILLKRQSKLVIFIQRALVLFVHLYNFIPTEFSNTLTSHFFIWYGKEYYISVLSA